MIITDPVYGKTEITGPVIFELINTQAMQRLKGVDQNSVGGIAQKPWGKFTRFDHCLGVMFLIKKLGGSLEEQIAGLLHDVSHTAFSHAMDFVFGSEYSQDFHEKHLHRIVEQSNIPKILKKSGYNINHILDHRNFSILEQDIPALCADRIDYALKTFATSFKIPTPKLKQTISDLTTWNGLIVFRHQNLARDFADLFLRGDIEVWGGSYLGNAVYHLFAKIIKQAYDRGEITLDDFFTTDAEFMDKLEPNSKKEIEKLRHMNFSEVRSSDSFDLHVNAKIRYVDPPVLTGGKPHKLSEIDTDFAEKLQKFLARRKQGNYVKISARALLEI